MAEVLVLEFDAPNADAAELYQSVSRQLGVDPSTGSGDWPAPMSCHVAGVSGGKLIVVEVWESRAVQEEFMHSRLGPVMQELNAPQPTRVEWLTHAGEMHRH
jgi:hypothetical protein